MAARDADWGNPLPQHEAKLLDLLRCHARTKDAAEARALERLIRRLIARDLVVVLTWDTAGVDVDLHVVGPDGAECSHERTITRSGGWLDDDNTDGPGPETYRLRRAKPGKYRIDIVYYEGKRPTKATVRIYRHRHGEDEKLTTHTVELVREEQRVTVATIEIPAPD